MQRESAWKKEQSILEEDSNSLSVLRKEITKESEIDASVQLSINEKIEVLKQNATALAKKLQNEKHKNAELQTIIAHLNASLQKERLQEANFRDSNSSESLSGLENKYKKYEYDLGQLNGKTNRISENVEEKRIKINQNRTERVIDSGIFRNIEKQLIQSELKFKKLLIQKIKYQKQYEKLLKNYEGLKEHAQNHGQQRQNKSKSGNLETSFSNTNNSNNQINKKFIHIDVPKDGTNNKPKSMTYIQQEHQFEEQKNAIIIKKLLSETALENCQELIYHFHHIDQINQKYFNEMMVYADQSNEIQKYLSQFTNKRAENKLHFYQKKRKPTKSQIYKDQNKKFRSILDETVNTTTVQMDQIANFFSDNNFKRFLNLFQMEDCLRSQDQKNLDDLKGILQTLQRQIQAVLSNQATSRDEKYKTSRTNQQQKLQELINRIKKSDENLNVMKKEDFQQEYHKILKASASKTSIIKQGPKRQSCIRLKKI